MPCCLTGAYSSRTDMQIAPIGRQFPLRHSPLSRSLPPPCSSPDYTLTCRRSRGTTAPRCSSWPPRWLPPPAFHCSSESHFVILGLHAAQRGPGALLLLLLVAAGSSTNPVPGYPCVSLACRSVDLENVAIVDSVLQFAQNLGDWGGTGWLACVAPHLPWNGKSPGLREGQWANLPVSGHPTLSMPQF